MTEQWGGGGGGEEEAATVHVLQKKKEEAAYLHEKNTQIGDMYNLYCEYINNCMMFMQLILG